MIRMGKGNRKPSFRSYFEQLYFPSLFSVLFIVSISCLFFAISRMSSFWYFSIPMLTFDTSSQFQNLIAIHAGTGAIIFASLSSVAESLRDDDTKDRARVLLRESFLFPLTVSEIMAFFIFVWGDVNVFSIIPVIIVAALTIYQLPSVARTFE